MLQSLLVHSGTARQLFLISGVVNVIPVDAVSPPSSAQCLRMSYFVTLWKTIQSWTEQNVQSKQVNRKTSVACYGDTKSPTSTPVHTTHLRSYRILLVSAKEKNVWSFLLDVCLEPLTQLPPTLHLVWLSTPSLHQTFKQHNSLPLQPTHPGHLTATKKASVTHLHHAWNQGQPPDTNTTKYKRLWTLTLGKIMQMQTGCWRVSSLLQHENRTQPLQSIYPVILK